MTQESQNWIYQKFLSGMEATHGAPWWKGRDFNPENHFDGPIPVEAVEKLFGYDVYPMPIYAMGLDGELFEIKGKAAWVPDDAANTVHGIFSDDAVPHQLRKWLIDGPAQLVNGVTGISNAGLLKNGAQAWVNISTPEAWKTVQGVEFRPQLLCTTSFDGSIASTYKQTHILSVCDNTREAALNSDGLVYKVKHTKNSEFKLKDAQAAFRLLEESAAEFCGEIRTLCERKVTDAQFDAFMAKLVPLPEISDKDINKRDYSTRTATVAANKRAALNELYRLDGRVAPWQGTAFGVLQMVNTYTTHIASQRGVKDHRAARNMENVLNGSIHAADLNALKLLDLVCA